MVDRRGVVRPVRRVFVEFEVLGLHGLVLAILNEQVWMEERPSALGGRIIRFRPPRIPRRMHRSALPLWELIFGCTVEAIVVLVTLDSRIVDPANALLFLLAAEDSRFLRRFASEEVLLLLEERRRHIEALWVKRCVGEALLRVV